MIRHEQAERQTVCWANEVRESATCRVAAWGAARVAPTRKGLERRAVKPIGVLAQALALLAAVGTVGCSSLDNCASEDQSIEKVEGGASDLEKLTYESSPWNGPLHKFSAKKAFAFVHELGVTPATVQTFLSFSDDGTDGSNLAENAGNAGQIECVDQHVIVVRNGTCEEDLFVRVTASGESSASPKKACLETP